MSNQKSCYWPSKDYGKISATDNYVPCRNTTDAQDHTHCCSANDYCFTNGLCLDPGTLVPYRGGCTDENFQDAQCPKICLKCELLNCTYEQPLTKTDATKSGVWPCDSDTGFACDPSGCNNATERFTIASGAIMPGEQVDDDLNILANQIATASKSSTISSSTTTSAATSTLATNLAASPSSTAAALPTCDVSKGTVAGVGAGIGVPLFLALLVALAFLFRERKRSRNPVTMTTPTQPMTGWTSSSRRVELDSDVPTEIESSRPSSYRPK